MPKGAEDHGRNVDHGWCYGFRTSVNPFAGAALIVRATGVAIEDVEHSLSTSVQSV